MSRHGEAHLMLFRPVWHPDSREQPRIAIPDLGPFIAEQLAGATSNTV